MYSERGANTSQTRTTEVARLLKQSFAPEGNAQNTSPSSTLPSSSDAVKVEILKENQDSQAKFSYESSSTSTREQIRSLVTVDREKILPEVLIEVPDAAEELQAQLRIERPKSFELPSAAEVLERIEKDQAGQVASRAFRQAVLEAYRGEQ